MSYDVSHDAEISRLCDEGKKHREIASAIGKPIWFVRDRLARLGRIGPAATPNSIVIKSSKPKVQKKCPVCQKYHMSDPAIWTCEPCKKRQAFNEDTEVDYISVGEQKKKYF